MAERRSHYFLTLGGLPLMTFFYLGNIERTRAFLSLLGSVGSSTCGAFGSKGFRFSKLGTGWCSVVFSFTV